MTIRNCLATISATLLLLVLAACGTVAGLQDRFVFPNANEGPMDRPPPAGAEQIWLTAQDGSHVEGWLFLPPSSSPVPAVLFIHGNSDYIENKIEYADFYVSQGRAVLLMEYRGYRRSTGTPTEAALVEDAQAFYDMMSRRPEIDAERISVHGVSLGGAVAAEVASSRGANALILQSTFPSISELMATVLVPSFVLKHEFDTRASLERFSGPTLILHGNHDEIVPVRLARALASRSNARLEIIPGDHDLPHDWRAFAAILSDFLTQADQQRHSAVAP